MDNETFTIECLCGVIHEEVPQQNPHVVCGCGRQLNGLFGLRSQMLMNDFTNKLITSMRIGRLATFTTQELADEVARRIKVGE